MARKKLFVQIVAPLVVGIWFCECSSKTDCSKDQDCGSGFFCIQGICQQSLDGSVDGGGDDPEMVSVSAGKFIMGCSQEVDENCDNDELAGSTPNRLVSLTEFEIDRTEVTQAAYQRCVQTLTCAPVGNFAACGWDPNNRAHFPVVCVSWQQAKRYCEWNGKRLPTEAEWEKAARGTEPNIYPWGNMEPSCQRANILGCNESSIEVGGLAIGVSPSGAMDMAGNVWEWVNDYYDLDYYQNAPDQDPPGPATGTHRVIRGGSFFHEARHARVSNRGAEEPTAIQHYLGFRCAR